jgi:hypothetical protein
LNLDTRMYLNIRYTITTLNSSPTSAIESPQSRHFLGIWVIILT